MRLIIGGYAQGKLEYVKKQYEADEKYIFDSALPTKEECETLTEKNIVIYNLHKWIKKRIKEGGKPEEEILSFVKKHDNCIVISDEIGNGIVPMDPFERVYRERTGRILTSIASEASGVERIICGIPQKIK